MDIGKNILKLRKRQGLSQEQLAEKMGVTRQTISNWELEESSPDIKQAKELSKIFNVSLDQLVNNAEYIHNDNSSRGYEYISKTKIRGLPLVHINVGLGREIRTAKGIVAIGNIAKGIVALGGVSLGLFTLGAVSIGLISLGAFALGLLLSIAGLSIGSIAIGGIAIGLFSIGGVSIGLYSIGGIAIAKYVASGDYAYGYIAIGNHVKGSIELLQNEVTSPEIKSVVLQHFPKTWNIIVYLISIITY